MAVATGLPQVCPTKSCKPGKIHDVTDDKSRGGEAHDHQDVENSEEVEGLSSEWWGFQTPMHRAAVEEKHAPVHGVPHDVMTLIFSRLSRQSLANARVVCSSWKRIAEHQELAALRRQVWPPLLPLHLFNTHRPDALKIHLTLNKHFSLALKLVFHVD